jgi:hypothetical protein
MHPAAMFIVMIFVAGMVLGMGVASIHANSHYYASCPVRLSR